MEIRLEGYKFTVVEVAKDLLGPELVGEIEEGPLGVYDVPLYRRYLPLFHQGIRDRDPNQGNLVANCHNIIKPVQTDHEAHKGTAFSAEGISYTFSAALLYGDELVNSLSPFHQRFVLDLALGIAQEDYLSRQLHTTRNAAYSVEADRSQELREWSENWSRGAQRYANYQQRLRTLAEKPAKQPVRRTRRLPIKAS